MDFVNFNCKIYVIQQVTNPEYENELHEEEEEEEEEDENKK
jgi:uncharacterized protein YutD